MSDNIKLIQPISREIDMIVPINKIYVHRRTKYQEVLIAEIQGHGKALILDGYVQSSLADEFVYHECLVHPVLVVGCGGGVLVVGGGEGATVREVVKHGCVGWVDMVDIDGELVEIARKHLWEWHRGALNHPKTKIIIKDGKQHIKQTPPKTYKTTILDLTDPYSTKTARELYNVEFYDEVYRVLSDDGIMVTQAGSAFYYPEEYDEILKAVKEVFPIVREYNVWVPIYGYANSFIVGSKRYDPSVLTASEVDEILRKRGVKTKFYNGKTHVALFNTPVYRNWVIEHESREG